MNTKASTFDTTVSVNRSELENQEVNENINNSVNSSASDKMKPIGVDGVNNKIGESVVMDISPHSNHKLTTQFTDCLIENTESTVNSSNSNMNNNSNNNNDNYGVSDSQVSINTTNFSEKVEQVTINNFIPNQDNMLIDDKATSQEYNKLLATPQVIEQNPL